MTGCGDPFAEEFPEGLDVRVAAPQQVDYRLQFGGWLPEGDTIATGEAAGDNVEIVSSAPDGTDVVAWVRPPAGADAGDFGTLTFHVITAAGRETWDSRIVRFVEG